LTDWNKIPSITKSLADSWRKGLLGLTEKEIQKGLAHTRDHVGFFDIGVFRRYCTQAEAKYHEPVKETARLSDLSSFGRGPRWKELSKVTAAMMEEEGDGPLTRASKQGKLRKHVIKNKSADEIIEHAQKLYGQ
jgi:hypothetical protein